MNEEKALRYNTGKVKWSLVHYKSLEPMVKVLEYGAKKYAPFNWMKGLNRKEILESMQRHLAALIDGEEIDSESGISHMGHVMCNGMFYNYFTDNESVSLQDKVYHLVKHKEADLSIMESKVKNCQCNKIDEIRLGETREK